MTQLANLSEIKSLIAQGAIFYVSHSGGKDSQAQYIAINKLVPQDQIRVIHADLGHIEHRGTFNHILETVHHDVIVAKARDCRGHEISLFDMIRNRRASLDRKGQHDKPAFPSSAQRFCTSDLKTGPIWREIRNDGDHEIVVNCVGIRGDESASRAKKIKQRGTLNLNGKNTNSKRQAYDWWPIAHWTDQEVFWEIWSEGQEPHPAYDIQVIEHEAGIEFKPAGNERLSCEFCIFGSRNDLRLAKQRRPDLFAEICDLEIEVRSTMFNGESLAERTA